MALKSLPPSDLLHQLFRYEPGTGYLIWNARPIEHFADERLFKIWNTRYSGKRAGCSDGKGHRMVRINRVAYFQHRVIWAMHHGECTATDIDHIDGDGGNNRIENLRAVTHSENARNMRRPADNKSGTMGVRWDKRRSCWVAEIGARSSRRWLGQYKNLDEAIAARQQAELAENYHPNHGRALARAS